MSKIIHLRLPDEVIDTIDKCFEGENVTAKIRNYLSSQIINKEHLLAEKKSLQLRIGAIDKALKSNIFFDLGNLNEDEKKFLHNTKKLIEERPSILHGRREAFSRQFNRHITTNEFRLLLSELKDGS